MAYRSRIARNTGGVVGQAHDAVIGKKRTTCRHELRGTIEDGVMWCTVHDCAANECSTNKTVAQLASTHHVTSGANFMRQAEQAAEWQQRELQRHRDAGATVVGDSVIYERGSQDHAAMAAPQPLYDKPAGEAGMAGRITDADKAVAFILAGSATVTLLSISGTRYTYKINRAKYEEHKGKLENEHRPWFVSLLSGPDNTSDYVYLGMIKHNQFSLTRASKMTSTSPPVAAFRWTWERLVRHHMPSNVEVWHEGRCGRCNRKLTVPESIETGFGPECAGKVGL